MTTPLKLGSLRVAGQLDQDGQFKMEIANRRISRMTQGQAISLVEHLQKTFVLPVPTMVEVEYDYRNVHL